MVKIQNYKINKIKEYNKKSVSFKNAIKTIKKYLYNNKINEKQYKIFIDKIINKYEDIKNIKIEKDIKKFEDKIKTAKFKSNNIIDLIKIISNKRTPTITNIEKKLFTNKGKFKQINTGNINEINELVENAEIDVEGRLTDKFKGFIQYNVKLKNIKTLEQYYNKVIEQMIKNNLEDANLIMTFKNKDGQIKRATIRNDFLQSFEEFNETMIKYENNEQFGSDPQINRLDGYSPNFGGFQLNSFKIEAYGGDNKFYFGKEIDLKKEKYYKKDKCISNSLKYYMGDNKEYDNLSYISEISIHDKNATILYDYPENFKFNDNIKIGVKWWDYEDENKLKYKKIIYENLKECVFHTNKTIEFDKNNEHLYIYRDNHIAPYGGISDDELYYNASKQLFKKINKNGKIEMKKIGDRRDINIGRKEEFMNETKYEELYIVYDLETIFDAFEDGLLKPYSLSYCKNNNNDENKNEIGMFFGYDCCEKFVNYLENIQNNKKIILIGYNNSNFDNYYIVKAFAKKNEILNDIFYSKNSILNIKFNGRHETYDLCKWTLCSLKNACKNFDTLFKKISDFDHNEIQEYYNKNKEINYFFHNKECNKKIYDFSVIVDYTEKPHTYNAPTYVTYIINKNCCECDKYKKLCIYNIFDCLSVNEIYNKVQNIIFPIKKDEDGNELKIEDYIYKYKTIGSFIYKKFMDRCKKNKINLPLLTMDYYKDTRKFLTAGRCECFQGKVYDNKNIYDVIDVVSLYPASMLNNIFPYGVIYDRYNYINNKINFIKIDDNKKYDEINKIDYKIYEKYFNDKIGFFWCEFDQKNLRYPILPRKYDDNNKKLSELDWKYKGYQKQFLNTVDIKQLIKYKCNIIISNGYVFSDIIDGKKLFEVMDEYKKMKQNEDILKEIKDKKYNDAARTMYKIILNSLSGKVIEGLHIEQTKYIKTDNEFREILNKILPECEKYINNIDLVEKIDGDRFILKYKISEQEAFKLNNRPIYLGVLIYAYSRKLMYDNIISISDTICYGDTDSAMLQHDELEKIKNNNPNIFGKEFGQFDIEKTGLNKCVFISPKNYFMFKDNILIKKGFKGINNNDKLLYKKDLKKYCIKNNKTYEIKKNIDIFDIYNNKLSYNSLSKTDNINNMINILFEKGKCYIMKSYLVKIKHDILQEKISGIYQKYNITKITIK